MTSLGSGKLKAIATGGFMKCTFSVWADERQWEKLLTDKVSPQLKKTGTAPAFYLTSNSFEQSKAQMSLNVTSSSTPIILIYDSRENKRWAAKHSLLIDVSMPWDWFERDGDEEENKWIRIRFISMLLISFRDEKYFWLRRRNIEILIEIKTDLHAVTFGPELIDLLSEKAIQIYRSRFIIFY